MRVIHINAVYGVLSTGRTVMQLDEELARFGVDSSTACSLGVLSENTFRIGSKADVKLHAALSRITGKSGYHSRGATKKLIAYLKREKPDIVHLHNLHGNYADLPALFAFLAEEKIPVAVTLHDCWWYTGKCCHYTADGCMKWQMSCGHCPRLKKDIPSFVFDRTEEMLRDKRNWFASLSRYAVIGVSDWITEEAKKSILKDADVITRIYNWVDTDVFRDTQSDIRARYGLEGKKLMLGVAGKWLETKGLSAFARLAESLAEDERLVLIGELPAGFSCGRILSIPRTDDQQELARWYSAADVFISLSGEESFGKVSAEALSCGTPILVLDSTASPELVAPGCGEVMEDARPGTVLAAARRVFASGKDGAACRVFALKNFSMETNVKSTFEVYKKLLNEE